MKKVKKKKKPQKHTKTEKSKLSTTDDPGLKKEENNKPDFGGLPDRDLKKNLGCG